MNPIKIAFKEQEKGELVKEWNIATILNRKDPNGGVNDKLVGSKGKDWPWDAFVTVDEEGASAEQIGRQIAKAFTAFAIKSKNATSIDDTTGGSFKHNQEFAFRRVVSDGEDLKPLSYYLLENDAVLLFRSLFAPDNSKDDLLKNDDLLEDFFGDADRGRYLINNTNWNIPQVPEQPEEDDV